MLTKICAFNALNKISNLLVISYLPVLAQDLIVLVNIGELRWRDLEGLCITVILKSQLSNRDIFFMIIHDTKKQFGKTLLNDA